MSHGRSAFLIAMCAAGICVAAAPEKQDPTFPSAEKRRIVEAKLRKAIIPKVHFENATVREALEFWKRKCVELDTPVSFVVRFDTTEASGDSPSQTPTIPREPIPNSGAPPSRLEDPPKRRIQFKGERVSCFDLLNVICEQAGSEWTIGARAIEIQPKVAASKATRQYEIAVAALVLHVRLRNGSTQQTFRRTFFRHEPFLAQPHSRRSFYRVA